MTLILNQSEGVMMQPLNDQQAINKQDIPRSNDENPESDDEVFPSVKGDEIASCEEVLKAIEIAYKDTKNLQVKLLNFARKVIIAEMGKKADKGLSAEDIVLEAVYRISIGKRKWYKNKVDNIEGLIYLTITSLIRIEAKKRLADENPLYKEVEAGHETVKKNPKYRVIPLYKEFDKNEDSYNSIADIESTKTNNKDSYEAAFDFEADGYEEQIDAIEEELKNDEIAFFVFQARLDGVKSNIDIGRDLGVDVKDVENALKRVKRVLLKVIKK